jgi:eukaryotic-like serine/threonine-protein kinase
MPDKVGQQIGNYRLIRLLGSGGFADVYLGQHVHVQRLQAAVKVLHANLAMVYQGGFLQEAETIAGMKHPHIIRILDFGIDRDNAPFLIMEYASFGTLRTRHPRGSIVPSRIVVSYMKQIIEALQYAHDHNLIHRDLKPENLLIGENGEIVLSDFGIASVVHGTASLETGIYAGTVSYSAPEQIQGKPRRASDQYSLGIIVYEWLSGERPFNGTMTEIISQQLGVAPSPLHEKIPNISSEVESVVMTALAKAPRQRFGSVQAFAIALEQASQPTRVSLSHPPLMVPPSNQVSRSIQLATSSDQLAPSQAPSNQTSEPTGGWTPTGKVPPPANGELSPSQSVQPPVMGTPPSQATPQALFSSPGVPYTPRGISRRKVVVGLAGLAVVGVAGGLLWLEHGHPQPVPPPVATPTPASTPAPKIMSVSPIIPAQFQTIIITGSGFGTHQPFTNTTSNYLLLQDITGGWNAGYQHDVVGVTVSAWTDNRIEITGFQYYGGPWTFRPGDQVVIAVWNPQTHAGPARFTTTVAD